MDKGVSTVLSCASAFQSITSVVAGFEKQLGRVDGLTCCKMEPFGLRGN